jgi:hypothetical protein
MERKPDTQEASICVVCAWREYTRDLTLKAKPEGEAPSQGKK